MFVLTQPYRRHSFQNLGRKRRTRNDISVCNLTGVVGFIRRKLVPHCGMYPIASNEKMSLSRFTVGKMNGHFIAAVLLLVSCKISSMVIVTDLNSYASLVSMQ